MKWINVKTNGNDFDIMVHPIIKAMGIFYVGLSMAHLSLRKEAEIVFSDIMLIILAVLGGGFMMYGVLIFIKDVKKSKSIEQLIDRIKKNIND